MIYASGWIHFTRESLRNLADIPFTPWHFGAYTNFNLVSTREYVQPDFPEFLVTVSSHPVLATQTHVAPKRPAHPDAPAYPSSDAKAALPGFCSCSGIP